MSGNIVVIWPIIIIMAMLIFWVLDIYRGYIRAQRNVKLINNMKNIKTNETTNGKGKGQ
tara:strand:+ start:2098 stop:2274 length:177 start_codon:yes stop_codon:yes gene_type:complete